MDIQFLLWFQELRTPVLDNIMSVITMLGEEVPLIGVICLIYWCINKQLAQRLMFNFYLGGLINQFLKITFCVQRPWVRDSRVVPVESAIEGASGYSFPSGHTATATAMYGTLAAHIRKRWVWIFCTALILLIGFSRLYLGVHTLQDVLVSLIVGSLLVMLMARVLDAIDSTEGGEYMLFGAGIILTVALVVYASVKGYPGAGSEELVVDTFKVGGASLGLFTGWLFERKLVRFDTSATIGKQIIKYALGIALVLAIKSFTLPEALFGVKAWSLIRYALLSFQAIGLWPYIFKKYIARLDYA